MFSRRHAGVEFIGQRGQDIRKRHENHGDQGGHRCFRYQHNTGAIDENMIPREEPRPLPSVMTPAPLTGVTNETGALVNGEPSAGTWSQV